MSKKKPSPRGRPKKNTAVSLVRSSAAEYLTFVAASGAGGVEAVYADENVWLTLKMLGLLYDVETHTINYRLKTVFADRELQEDSAIRNFRITATASGRLLYSAQNSVYVWFGGKTANSIRRTMPVSSLALRNSAWQRDVVNLAAIENPRSRQAEPRQFLTAAPVTDFMASMFGPQRDAIIHFNGERILRHYPVVMPNI